MTEQQRIADIRRRLLAIANEFAPNEDNPEITMFWLVSQYNEKHDNPELIGGSWVREHVPELADLP